MQKFYQFIPSLVMIAMVCGFVGMPASAEELMIRGEINPADGTQIRISAPVSLLETLKSPMPAPFKVDQEKLCALVDGMLGDIASMKGQNLALVEGKDMVRFWVDGVDEGNPAEANFIKVSVQPAEEGQPKIEVCIPKGLFLLASFLGNVIMEQQGEQFFKMMGHSMPPLPPVPMEKPKHEEPQKHMEQPEKSKDHAPNPEEIKNEILKGIIKDLKNSMGDMD
ncbi:MAG: hypothetical protein RBU29_05030 [bacterium]|jgi:hypothetical protein|nr:hypothetical protein [bacterium]